MTLFTQLPMHQPRSLALALAHVLLRLDLLLAPSLTAWTITATVSRAIGLFPPQMWMKFQSPSRHFPQNQAMILCVFMNAPRHHLQRRALLQLSWLLYLVAR